MTGWEDRNFLGGLRRLTIDLRPGVGLYPTRIPANGAKFTLPKAYLLQGRARAELRQPGVPRSAHARACVQGQFNMYPVIFPAEDDTAASDWTPGYWVLGYRNLGTSVGLEREFGPI